MEATDWVIVFATLLGPILAVQAQRLVDIRRDEHARRNSIFRVLMATRAASVSTAHVEALNAIPIEFYGPRKKYKNVVEAWKALLDHLNNADNLDLGLWGQKRQELFLDLLWRLALVQGYRFSKVELQREVYSPRGHATIENEQEMIRKGLYRIFSGEAAFPLDIRSFPVDPEDVEDQKRLRRLLEQWLAGERAPRVTQEQLKES